MSRGGRPSARVRDHAHGVGYHPNPKWPAKHGQMEACHDGTPSIDFPCSSCGATSHMHESQIANVPIGVFEVAVRCHVCRAPRVVELRALRRAFDAAREAMRPTDG